VPDCPDVCRHGSRTSTSLRLFRLIVVHGVMKSHAQPISTYAPHIAALFWDLRDVRRTQAKSGLDPGVRVHAAAAAPLTNS
jgi:hypothetical protein